MTRMLSMFMSKREEGFTLIEMLVVVLILGILAAIAVPVFLNQRNEARDSSVKSDLNSLASKLEAAYAKNNVYPDAGELNVFDPRTSPGNVLLVSFYEDDGVTAVSARDASPARAEMYRICGYNVDSTKAYLYDSDNGGLVEITAGNQQDCTADIGPLGEDNVEWIAGDASLTVIDSAAGAVTP